MQIVLLIHYITSTVHNLKTILLKVSYESRSYTKRTSPFRSPHSLNVWSFEAPLKSKVRFGKFVVISNSSGDSG